MSKKASEMCAVVGAVDPVEVDGNTSTVTTGWVNAKFFDRFMAVVLAGTLGTSATLDAKIQQATDNSGTGVKDVTGAAITQLTATDDNKQAVINLKQTELDLENDFNHIRLSITISSEVDASVGAGTLLGLQPIHYPASDNDASTVAEIAN